MKEIRNFSIIAHIDHGKSTLADRLLEETQTVPARQMREQVLDSLELERERGITIKAKAVRMRYGSHILNLIDTPGHVDFSYEVSRALAACEGALLVVDASQGVEAQTLANAELAKSLGLKLVPVINKIDLPRADVEGTRTQVAEYLGLKMEPLLASAKEGTGVREILEAVVREIPPPPGDPQGALAALAFDSFYDSYRGVVLLLRVVDGALHAGMKLKLFSSGRVLTAEEVGHLTPKREPAARLSAGEVGYLVTGIKDARKIRVGDTVMEASRPLARALPGYREAKPVVFAGFFPINAADYESFKSAIDKIRLEDSSFTYQAETSQALGFGFRFGFLGLLHMEILKERLEREYNLSLIATTPNVAYQVRLRGGARRVERGEPDPDNVGRGAERGGADWMEMDNPAKFPEYGQIQEVREPVVSVTIVAPVPMQEPVMDLLRERRGEHLSVEYLSGARMVIRYRLPLAEMVLDFYDRLKSATRGYASFDYTLAGFAASDLAKLEILVHGQPVDALSQVVHRQALYPRAKALCEKLKELIPRQIFEVAIQARAEGRFIARETLPAMRKDVIAKCYGGDITRKRKLLERQKEGKKKAKLLGRVEIPQEAFLAALKIRGS